MKKTYKGWQEWGQPGEQEEYTQPTTLLGKNGTLLAAGWARHGLFEYDRSRVKHKKRRKEWDFYQISNGRYMVQLNFANISIGGYASAMLVDLKQRKILASTMAPFVGGADKYVLPARGDELNRVDFQVGGVSFLADTTETARHLRFEGKGFLADFTMDILPGQENITTVLPFDGYPDRYFMTTKQNCLACEGVFKAPGVEQQFSREDTFCVLDWGRVCTPYRLVWYWGNGSARITEEDGSEHLFGFEITWGIGNESHATETCLFYDGRAHKIGPVDVETFPKPDGYLKTWKFVSRDGRFNLSMEPFYDHHSDLNVLVMRMHSHQVHGLWSGTVTLDDGRVLSIKDMYAFCEYVENRW